MMHTIVIALLVLGPVGMVLDAWTKAKAALRQAYPQSTTGRGPGQGGQGTGPQR